MRPADSDQAPRDLSRRRGLALGATAAILLGSDVAVGENRHEQQQLENTLGVSSVRSNHGFSPIQFGALGDGVHDDTAAFVAMLDAVPAGSQLQLAGHVYKLTAISVTKGLVFTGGRLVFSSFSDKGVAIDILTLDRCVFENVDIVGPGGASQYVIGQRLINCVGKRGDFHRGLTLQGCRLSGSGSHGLYGQFVDDVILEDLHVEDTAYAGIMLMSCTHVRIDGGYIDVFDAVGAQGNAYGLTLTHSSAGYAQDLEAGTSLAANPFCRDALIHGLTVRGPRIWQAIDCHGAYATAITSCRTYGSRFGIAVTSGSGDASRFAGSDNLISGNVVDSNDIDGRPVPGLNVDYGLTLQGGGLAGGPHERFIATENIVRGYGSANEVATGAIRVNVNARKALISQNIIENWAGMAISLSTGSSGVLILGNIFGDLRQPVHQDGGGESLGYCVHISGAFNGNVLVNDNAHEAEKNRAAAGLMVEGDARGKVVYGANIFSTAVTAISGGEGQIHGVGHPGSLSCCRVSGAVAPDLAFAADTPGVPTTLRFCELTGPTDLHDIRNAANGQIVIVINEDSVHLVRLLITGKSANGSTPKLLSPGDAVTLIRGTAGWIKI